jgi:phage-related minor tail protein
MSWFLPSGLKRTKRASVHLASAPAEAPMGAHAVPAGVNQATEYAQRREEASILVTDELDRAIQRCREKVAQIAKDCRYVRALHSRLTGRVLSVERCAFQAPEPPLPGYRVRPRRRP